MKYLALIAFLSFSMVASAQNCIPYKQAWKLSESLPSNIPAEDLPALRQGWKWFVVYTPSRDPELQITHWMSWPDGETLTLCQL